MRYRWDLLPEVAGLVAQGRPDAAAAQLDELLAEIRASSPPGLAVFRLRCAVCMSSWVRGARAAGADSGWLLDDHMRALAVLARQRSRRGIAAHLRRYLAGLASAVRAAVDTRQERIVREIREDIAASLRAPRSLAHYARAVGVSCGHLSRLFSRVAGASFSATQASIRHQAVVHLLTTTSLTVAAIAEAVGVRSPSQLIAAFRRRAGATPHRFRQRWRDASAARPAP
jgi:AraC-like DNA-binding protein